MAFGERMGFFFLIFPALSGRGKSLAPDPLKKSNILRKAPDPRIGGFSRSIEGDLLDTVEGG